MFAELESGCHEVGSSFDYFAHGASVGYARGSPCEYGPLSQACPSCPRLRVPNFINPPVRHFVEELTSV